MGGVVAVGWRRIAVPVWASMGAAALLRVLFAGMTSREFTPNDVRVTFHTTGELVLQGKDPLSHLPPGGGWNFLELMPYIHALEIKTGWPWVYADKIAPVVADVLVVWLVAQLVGSDGRTRALQYAINPLSLLVVGLHGQVEPVALAFGLGGILLAKHDRWLLAGVLLGAAVSAKTWPVLIAIAIFPITRPREALRLVEGIVVVPIAMLVSGIVFLDTHLVTAVKHIVSYSSYVDNWGWGGLVVTSGRTTAVGYNTTVGHIGSALAVVAVVIVLVVFRDRPMEVRAMVVLSAFLVATAGFGTQYLLWPLPLMFAVGGIPRIAYLAHWPTLLEQGFLAGFSWLVIATLVWSIWDAYVNPVAPATMTRPRARSRPAHLLRP
jgi:Glycosyltransferase family 87